MTLLDEIRTRCTPELLASRELAPIAAAVSQGRTRIVSRLGGIGLVLETLGPAEGAALLDTLQALSASVSALKWALMLVSRGELDFGSSATRAMLDQLATLGAITPSNAAQLKAVAVVPDPVDEFDVRCTLWAVDGTWLGG